jgi:hypothetical protein
VTEPEQDTLALSGLRRLVLHARDQLTATLARPPVGRDWRYQEAWHPNTIARHAAQLLAVQALTLVAECIPGGERLSEDEAVQRVAAAVADRDERERGLRAEVARLGEQATKLAGQVELLTTERDEAWSTAGDAEAAEADATERLVRAEQLAKTDAAAAVRLLLGDET